MTDSAKSRQALVTEIAELRLRLEEAEETLRAIGSGEVDAFVVAGPEGQQIFTLKGAEQPYRVLVESMNEGAATLAADGTILYCNGRLAALLQLPIPKLLGTRLGCYVLPADRPLFAARLDSYPPDSSTDEISLVTRSGYVVPVLISRSAVDLSGSRGISVVVTDLTQQKRNEEIMASERLALSIIEQAGEAIVVCNEAGEIIQANRLAQQLCLANPLLKRFDALFPLRMIGSGTTFASAQLLEGGRLENVEVEYRRHDEQTFHLLLNATPLLSGQQRVIGCVLTLTDISERKRAEEEMAKLECQLQHAQKLDSVGRLAGGVAHDFNNMLGVIVGHANLVLMDLEAPHPFHSSLLEIRKAAERSADLTRQLLAFARKQTISPRVLQVNDTIASMLNMLQRMIGEGVVLDWQPLEGVWPVKLDPSQLDQILANLCVNARDSIADIGKITIETANCVLDEHYPADCGGFVPGDYVRLTVSDNGCGMDKETLALMFEPFFTTKGTGKGTGLGLATVHGAVKQNHGFISVLSEPGLGTAFSVFLPRYAGDVPQATGGAAESPARRGHETILLVEDEPAILQVASTILTRQSYDVLAARSPRAAMQLARENAGRISLLLTDVVMPEMNGRDLARELLARDPQLKRLFMSGFTADVIADRGAIDEGVHFIQKPFSVHSLSAKVREVLDAATDSVAGS
jgi:PAS domain S-box-containing protein